MVRLRWVFIVASLIVSAVAISALDLPVATSRRIGLAGSDGDARAGRDPVP